MKKSSSNISSGYKPSPLGPIPEDWEVKRLGEIAEIGSGGTPSKNHSEYWNGNIPWVTTSLLNNPYIENAEEYITEEGLNNSSAKMLNEGVLLMAMYGQGQTRGRVSKLLIRASTNQACAYIDVQTGLVDYIHQTLIANYESIRNESNDGNQKNLSLGIISNIRISFPPLSEQHRIVDVLELWDTAIAKQTALIEKLTLRKRGLMQQLLTGKKRLEGFCGEWKEVRLGEVCPMERGEMLTSDNYLQGDIPVIAGGKEPAGFHSYANRQKNTITISCSGASAGFVAFHDVPIFATDCFTISESNAYNIWFIYHVLTNLQEKIYKLQTGGAQPHVHPKDVYPMKIHIPSIKEQNAIASVLVNADKEIEIQKQKLAAMQEQKRGLMQVLLTGKRRIL